MQPLSDRYDQGYENGKTLADLNPETAREELGERYLEHHFDPELRRKIGSFYKLLRPEKVGYVHGLFEGLEEEHPDIFEELMEEKEAMEIDYW